jgi:hypothetical protein
VNTRILPNHTVQNHRPSRCYTIYAVEKRRWTK